MIIISKNFFPSSLNRFIRYVDRWIIVVQQSFFLEETCIALAILQELLLRSLENRSNSRSIFLNVNNSVSWRIVSGKGNPVWVLLQDCVR